MVCEILISVVCGRFEFTKLGSFQSEFHGHFGKKMSEIEGDMSKKCQNHLISTNLAQKHSPCRELRRFHTIFDCFRVGGICNLVFHTIFDCFRVGGIWYFIPFLIVCGCGFDFLECAMPVNVPH